MDKEMLLKLNELWINNLNRKVKSEGMDAYVGGYSDALDDVMFELGIEKEVKEL